jgi:hypothetical protein
MLVLSSNSNFQFDFIFYAFDISILTSIALVEKDNTLYVALLSDQCWTIQIYSLIELSSQHETIYHQDESGFITPSIEDVIAKGYSFIRWIFYSC